MIVNKIDLYILPGDCCVARSPSVLHTTLGSCVAVTLWHPALLQGGMCHYLLSRGEGVEAQDVPGRYGDKVLPLMFQTLARVSDLSGFNVGLYGGSAILFAVKGMNIGDDNLALATQWIEQHGLTVSHQSIGGAGCRTLDFDLRTGRVSVKEFHELT